MSQHDNQDDFIPSSQTCEKKSRRKSTGCKRGRKPKTKARKGNIPTTVVSKAEPTENREHLDNSDITAYVWELLDLESSFMDVSYSTYYENNEVAKESSNGREMCEAGPSGLSKTMPHNNFNGQLQMCEAGPSGLNKSMPDNNFNGQPSLLTPECQVVKKRRLGYSKAKSLTDSASQSPRRKHASNSTVLHKKHKTTEKEQPTITFNGEIENNTTQNDDGYSISVNKDAFEFFCYTNQMPEQPKNNLNSNILSDANENVPHEKKNVPHENQNVSHEKQNVPHEKQNVPHENQNVPHENLNVPHENQNVPHENQNVPHENQNVPHENEIESDEWNQCAGIIDINDILNEVVSGRMNILLDDNNDFLFANTLENNIPVDNDNVPQEFLEEDDNLLFQKIASAELQPDERYKPKITSESGFYSASGKCVQISAEAKQKAKKLFTDTTLEEVDVENIDLLDTSSTNKNAYPDLCDTETDTNHEALIKNDAMNIKQPSEIDELNSRVLKECNVFKNKIENDRSLPQKPVQVESVKVNEKVLPSNSEKEKLPYKIDLKIIPDQKNPVAEESSTSVEKICTDIDNRSKENITEQYTANIQNTSSFLNLSNGAKTTKNRLSLSSKRNRDRQLSELKTNEILTPNKKPTEKQKFVKDAGTDVSVLFNAVDTSTLKPAELSALKTNEISTPNKKPTKKQKFLEQPGTNTPKKKQKSVKDALINTQALFNEILTPNKKLAEKQKFLKDPGTNTPVKKQKVVKGTVTNTSGLFNAVNTSTPKPAELSGLKANEISTPNKKSTENQIFVNDAGTYISGLFNAVDTSTPKPAELSALKTNEISTSNKKPTEKKKVIEDAVAYITQLFDEVSTPNKKLTENQIFVNDAGTYISGLVNAVDTSTPKPAELSALKTNDIPTPNKKLAKKLKFVKDAATNTPILFNAVNISRPKPAEHIKNRNKKCKKCKNEISVTNEEQRAKDIMKTRYLLRSEQEDIVAWKLNEEETSEQNQFGAMYWKKKVQNRKKVSQFIIEERCKHSLETEGTTNQQRLQDPDRLIEPQIREQSTRRQKLFELNFLNSLKFEFDFCDANNKIGDFYPLVIRTENTTIIPNESMKIGFAEISRAFLAIPGVSIISLSESICGKWLENHYCMILLKLAMYETEYPELCSVCNPVNIIEQLKYRYDREITLKYSSCLKTIIEWGWVDRTPIMKCIVLIVLDITYESNDDVIDIILSDRWYAIRTRIDDEMKDLIKRKKVRIGTKLAIQDYEIILLGTRYKYSYLDPLSLLPNIELKINTNSVRRAKFGTALSFIKNPKTINVRLDSVFENGANIPVLQLFIARIYPSMYVPHANGSINQRHIEGEAEQENDDDENQSDMEMINTLNEIGVREANLETINEIRNANWNLKEYVTNKYPDMIQSLIDYENLQKKLKKNSEVLRVRVVDAIEPKKSAFLTIWNTKNLLRNRYKFEEGCYIELKNTKVESVDLDELYLECKINRSHDVKLLDRNERKTSFPIELKRRSYSIAQIATLVSEDPEFKSFADEIDICGIVMRVEYLLPNPFGYKIRIYLTDRSLDLVFIYLTNEREVYSGGGDALKFGKFIAACNLKIVRRISKIYSPKTHKTNKYVQFIATPSTEFTTQPKQNAPASKLYDVKYAFRGIKMRQILLFCYVQAEIKSKYLYPRADNNRNIDYQAECELSTAKKSPEK